MPPDTWPDSIDSKSIQTAILSNGYFEYDIYRNRNGYIYIDIGIYI